MVGVRKFYLRISLSTSEVAYPDGLSMELLDSKKATKLLLIVIPCRNAVLNKNRIDQDGSFPLPVQSAQRSPVHVYASNH